MMARRVVFHPEAERDLLDLYTYIVDKAQPRIAKAYIDRVIEYCDGFSTFPLRGASRPDLGSGARVVGFERRISIVFAVRGETVLIGASPTRVAL